MTVAVSDDEFDYGSDFSAEEEELIESLVDSVYVNQTNNVHLPILERRYISSVSTDSDKTSNTCQYIEEIYQNSEINNDSQKVIKANHECPTDYSLSLTRSPLKRFCSKGGKNLTVSDLVSPAWCEIRYWYTFATRQEKKKTIQMARGTQVHEKLERELYKPVQIVTKTKEDRWGIRLWNIIHALQLLRLNGYTRELEVWGLVDQQVVCGKIDELSYTHPDHNTEKPVRLAVKNKSLTYNELMSQSLAVKDDISTMKFAEPVQTYENRKVYLCDIKTRDSKKVFSKTSIRPIKIQLMLYHRLLLALISENVDFDFLSKSLRLDQSKLFSDSFLAQVIDLNQDTYDTPLDKESKSTEDFASVICTHNNLSSLWSLMIANFKLTFPNGAASLGDILKIEYRSRKDGEIIGKQSFLMDNEYLMSYIEHSMKWWKGEREAEGVSEAEAYKCRSCEFAETCEWRLNKVEQALERSRAKMKSSITQNKVTDVSDAEIQYE
ncbi:hypothetical protein K3495_g8374 [Podosphaera aphanis]|nr:hypothetical protein K3495_g8374 [Podosphaera aphanis]